MYASGDGETQYIMKVLNFYHCGKIIPENAIYIGRAMPHLGLPATSKFANPYKVTKEEPREIVIPKYKKWLWQQIKTGKITLEDLRRLYGKDLVCFCKQVKKEVPCHGDVLIDAVNWAMEQEDEQKI